MIAAPALALVTALLTALAAASPAAAQESLVAGISTENIALTADFTGSEVFVFGAIRRDAPIPMGESPLDIIVTLKGPARNETVRRKERVFGIWVNTASVSVRGVPSYYAVAATRPIADILTETERLRYRIGLDQAVRRFGAHPTIVDTSDFAEALVRLRLGNGLYTRNDHGVDLAEETLFQTRFEMPSNLVEGDYAAEIFMVRNKAVIGSGETRIRVRKAGIERWLFNLSREQPLLYGIFAVALALATGWLAAAAFQLGRR
jgi:uncharacterized protein (TIGR02186 family)